MASRSFLLLALAFAVVLLITSEVAAAKELASDNDSEINDSGRGGYHYKVGRHGGHSKGGGGRGGHALGGGRTIGGGHDKGCRHGCCGGKRYTSKECKCCSTLEEATAYKKTQN